MRVRPAVAIIFAFALVPSLVHALALGEINLNSSLNEPLDAEIEITSATAEEIANLTASIASRETFERYGLDRPDFLSGLRFRVDRVGSRDVLRVLSRQPISEPFVTFLVEAEWRRGRLLREYTVLLDPPVFLPTPEAAAPAPVAVPRSVQSQTRPSSGQVYREPQRTSPPPRRTYSATPPSFGAAYGPIRRNETLWGIAERLRTDKSVTMNQMMVAIYRANQDAFLGNINLMKEGSTLRIPTRAAIEAVAQPDAFATAVAHNRAWRSGTPARVATAGAAPSTVSSAPEPSRLQLVEPDGSGTGTDAGAGAGASGMDAISRETLVRNEADIARLSTENDQLRSDLEEIRRLLSVRDSELAELQRQVADGSQVTGPVVSAGTTDTMVDSPETTDAVATDTATDSVTTDAGQATAGQPGSDTMDGTDAVQAGVDSVVDTAADDGTDTVAAGTDSTTDAGTTDVPVVTTSLPDEPGIVTRVVDAAKGALGSLWLWLGLGAVALAVFGMTALRGRRTEDNDAIEALTREAQETVDDQTAQMKRPEFPDAETSSTAEVEFFDDSGTFKPVDFSAAQAADTESGEYPFEDTVGGELKLDQSDPLAEADFHMAYGLYDQASDLVKKAVAREPERIDLRMKLLEIFFVWGNQDEFRSTAHELRESMPDQIAGEWDKIAIMGKQICPEDELFQGDSGMGGAAADIDLEFSPTGQQASVDLDTGEESPAGNDSIDLDFDGAFGDAGVDEAGAEGVQADSAETMETPSSADTINDMLDLNFSDDDLSGLPVDDDETRPEPVDEIKEQIRSRLSNTDTDETAEMDLSDLGVDLDLASGTATPAEDEQAASKDEQEFGDIFGVESDATSELPAPTTELTAGGDALDLDIGDVFGGLDSGDDEETARDLEALEESMEQTGPAIDTGDTGHFSAEVETLHGDSLDVDISAFNDDDANATRLIAADEEPTGTHTDDAFSAQVFGDDESDETKMIGPEESTAGAEDIFSASIFGEEDTVQVPTGAEADEILVDEDSGGIDLDVGEDLPEGEDRTTVKVATTDLALPDGGDELSEVGTKLDLARAYMDMGDPDGARGILEEVLAEGNETQQADARDMLSSLT